MSLYSFDRQLRLLVLDALEHIEVRLRAAVTDEMSLKHQDAFWYTEPTYFRDLARHSEFLDQVSERSRRQLEGRPEDPGDVHNYRSALEHYLVTYGEPEFPPSWIMMEGLTFGQVKSLYDNLQQREDSNRIARQLGVPGPVLTSWLRTFCGSGTSVPIMAACGMSFSVSRPRLRRASPFLGRDLMGRSPTLGTVPFGYIQDLQLSNHCCSPPPQTSRGHNVSMTWFRTTRLSLSKRWGSQQTGTMRGSGT